MAITIKQIATMAGVSRGTVDRVLNRRNGVNPEVAARVLAIAQELCYEPNPVAKALANSKRLVRIHVLVNSGGNLFFEPVLSGIRRAARDVSRYGVTVTVEELRGYEVETQLARIAEISNEQPPPNGFVITPIDDKRVKDALNRLAEKGVSIVTLNADIEGISKLCFVGCDYLKSGKTAAELMGKMTMGRGVVGILSGSFKMRGHNKRVQGFKEVAARYPDLNIVATEEGEDDDHTAYEKTHKLINEYPITALYLCAGGVDGGIKAAKESGRRIIIISVDETGHIRDYLKDGSIAATVCQQPERQGQEAMLRLFEYLVHDKRPAKKHIYTSNEIKLYNNFEDSRKDGKTE